ncbi:hypothetical protein DXG01_005695 [Tephrocybe rancida]|nr:hypothetical protein DXG01_005695 [Tephrocybe rancida]
MLALIAPQPNVTGYGPAHAQYRQERGRMSKKVYKGKSDDGSNPVPEEVNITMQVIHEIAGKTKTELVVNIFEGCGDVSAHITAKDLHEFVMSQMQPKLAAATNGFPFKWDTMVVRELGKWIDLASGDPKRVYLYDRCQVEPRAKGHDGKKVFRKPSKPFPFALHQDTAETSSSDDSDSESELWQKYQKTDSSHMGITTTPAVPPKQFSGAVYRPSSNQGHSEMAASKEFLYSDRTNNSNVSGREASAMQTNKLSNWPTSAGTSSNVTMLMPVATAIVHPAVQPKLNFPMTPKRSRSTSTAENDLDNRSTQAKQQAMSYKSPDHERIRAALLTGGLSASLNVKACSSERIEFFPIIECPLEELLSLNSSDVQIFSYNHADSQPEDLGIGTFKTAHPGQLSLAPPSTTGLGTILNEPVAVKRMYYKTDLGKGKKKAQVEDTNLSYGIARYVFANELKKTLVEANIHYWSTSLMAFTYSFIDSVLAISPVPPSFEIPQLRFVKAGLAVSHEHEVVKGKGEGGPGSKAAVVKCAYLLEEFIESPCHHGFIKYIHNGSAVPCMDADHPLYELAQFLSFVQHVQYSKSGHLVYISDLQGKFSSEYADMA